jgi:outer membrane protein assembly factor BamA
MLVVFLSFRKTKSLQPLANVGTYKIKNVLLFAVLCLAGLLAGNARAQGSFTIKYLADADDQGFIKEKAGLTALFPNRTAGMQYIAKLPGLLKGMGYITASVDSIALDSTSANVQLFVGEKYRWVKIHTLTADQDLLMDMGWNEKMFRNQPLEPSRMRNYQERILDYLENRGYPFGKVELDSLQLDGGDVSARLVITRGPLYKIDSIHVMGDGKISAAFLQKYLGIENGSLYKKDKLALVSKRLLELPYLQEQRPWDMTMLGTGATLNLYLQPKRSNQVNVLIGLLPNNSQLLSNKLFITGEANVNLKNSFGGGEIIGLNWQRLQVQSQRLNLAYQQPYLFRSPFGIDFAFDLFKKDSSFVNISGRLGSQYDFSGNQSGKVYALFQKTNVSNIDTVSVKLSRRLPENIDVSSSSIGVEYDLNKTNYRLNPRRGFEMTVNASAGTKKIQRNNAITVLKDPADPGFNFASLYDSLSAKSYQLRVRLSGAKYFQSAKKSTVKLGVQAGLFLSPAIFRNELFQIGGYKLLRGFDEESIFSSQYAISTLEYRYLIGLNSYFFVFADGGWSKNNSIAAISKEMLGYYGTGLGLAFETKAGIINISYAVGKRPVDSGLNFRQSKIHFGYVNYF